MKTSFSYYLLQNSIDSFQNLINTYNNQETSVDVKTQSLEEINDIWCNFLKETSPSQKGVQEFTDLLKQIKVQSPDLPLWNQLVGEMEKVSPTPVSTQLFIEGPINQLPDELYLLIAKKLEMNAMCEFFFSLYVLCDLCGK